MRALLCMLSVMCLLAVGCSPANGPANRQAQGNKCGGSSGDNEPAPDKPAPDGDTPQKSLRELYLDAVSGHDQANYMYSYEVPGFPGVMCFAIPNNTPDSRTRWFVGRQMLAGGELSQAALATRGWDKADAAAREELARQWIAAVEAPILNEMPAYFPVDETGQSQFRAPETTHQADGAITITGWQERVVDYGAAGGTVYFVEGTWTFSPGGAMTSKIGPKVYAR